MARRRRARTTTRAAPPRVGTRAVAAAGGPRYRRLVRLVRRRPVAICAALVLLHVGLALLTFEPRPHPGGDNGAYITLGRSLLEHGSYTELWDPAAAPHTKYPPVFPALLAVAMAVGLAPWVQLKFVVLGMSAAAVALSFIWIRSRRRAALALGVGIVLAVAPGVLREGRWLLSDVPFWAFTMLAIWAFERLPRRHAGRFAIAAAGCVLAYFTRSAGLPLVLAALGWLAWRRRGTQLGLLAVAVGVPAILWWLRTRAYGPAGYISEFWFIDPYLPALGTIGVVDMLHRILENAWKYVAIHLPVLLFNRQGGLLTMVSAATFGLAAFGWLLRLRRVRVADLFLPAYLGLILIWPAIWSGERFLLPVLPLLLYYAGDGLVAAVHRLAPGRGMPAAAGAGSLVLLLTVPGLLAGAAVGLECTRRFLDGERYPCMPSVLYDEFFHVAEVTGVALPEGAVVLNRKPRLFYVIASGVRGINYPMTDDPEAFFDTAEAVDARYVVFDRMDAVSDVYLRPVLILRPEAFCVMRAYEQGTVLFGILPGRGIVPDTVQDPGERSISFGFCPPEYWRDEAAMRQYEGM